MKNADEKTWILIFFKINLISKIFNSLDEIYKNFVL